MISCPCGLIFIGETTIEIRKRISKHKSTIRTGLTDLPIPKHFMEMVHYLSQLKSRVIDSVPIPRRGGDRQAMLMDCLSPRGLNLEFKLHTVAIFYYWTKSYF